MKTRLLLIGALLAISVGCTTIGPGYEGIKINSWGTTKGVQDLVATTGMVTYNPFTESVVKWPTNVHIAKWTRNNGEGKEGVNEEISFNSKQGTSFTADVQVAYHVLPGKSPHFYVKYRTNDMDEFTHGMMKNEVRKAIQNVAENYSDEEIYATNKVKIQVEVTDAVNKVFTPDGLFIDSFGFIEAPRPPQAIMDAITAKQVAIQNALKVQNELAATQAEALKVAAKAEGEAKASVAIAQGQAEANKLLTASLSDRVMEWQTLQLLKEKWDGAYPQFLSSGGSSNVLMSLPVPPKATAGK